MQMESAAKFENLDKTNEKLMKKLEKPGEKLRKAHEKHKIA